MTTRRSNLERHTGASAELAKWIDATYGEIQRILGAGRPWSTARANDMAQMCAERVLRHPERYRARYGSPAGAAGALTRSAVGGINRQTVCRTVAVHICAPLVTASASPADR
jgi:hypothetical protein